MSLVTATAISKYICGYTYFIHINMISMNIYLGMYQWNSVDDTKALF